MATDQVAGLIDKLRRVASCVYLAAEEGPARDISDTCISAAAELTRLSAGKFTKEEIHAICHNLHGTVDAQAFADGCAAEQIKLYGTAPDRDKANAQTIQALKNSGIDTECGACMEVAFTGVTTNAHTCRKLSRTHKAKDCPEGFRGCQRCE